MDGSSYLMVTRYWFFFFGAFKIGSGVEYSRIGESEGWETVRGDCVLLLLVGVRADEGDRRIKQQKWLLVGSEDSDFLGEISTANNWRTWWLAISVAAPRRLLIVGDEESIELISNATKEVVWKRMKWCKKTQIRRIKMNFRNSNGAVAGTKFNDN